MLFRGSGIRKIVAGSLYIVEVGGRAVHSTHFAVDIDAVHVDAAVHIQRGLRIRRIDADFLFTKRNERSPLRYSKIQIQTAQGIEFVLDL